MVRSARGNTASKLRLVVDHGEVPPRPTRDDNELVAAVRAGDVSAASDLHDRVVPQIRRTIDRLFGRRDAEHEDLAQLALIEIIGGIDTFRAECSLDTWTSRVTAHVVFNHLRRRKLERRIFEREGDLDRCASPSHDGPVALRSVLGRIRQHLATIEERKAWTFVLHDVCGYDLREIATITESSVAAAQQRLSRARRELHAKLEGDPELAEIMSELGGES